MQVAEQPTLGFCMPYACSVSVNKARPMNPPESAAGSEKAFGSPSHRCLGSALSSVVCFLTSHPRVRTTRVPSPADPSC